VARLFSAPEFVKALTEGALNNPIVKEGMVKVEKDDPHALFFSEGTHCYSWARIPFELIEQVEYIATVPCQDHEHPIVRIQLKEPPADNPIARSLAALVRRSAPEGEPSPHPEQTFPCRFQVDPCVHHWRRVTFPNCSSLLFRC
jgi:hypothetical protein